MLTVEDVVLLVLAGSFLTGALWLDGQPAVQAQDDHGNHQQPARTKASWLSQGAHLARRPRTTGYAGRPPARITSPTRKPSPLKAAARTPTPRASRLTTCLRERSTRCRSGHATTKGQHEDNSWSNETTATVSSPPTPGLEPTHTAEPTRNLHRSL